MKHSYTQHPPPPHTLCKAQKNIRGKEDTVKKTNICNWSTQKTGKGKWNRVCTEIIKNIPKLMKEIKSEIQVLQQPKEQI